jgi:hypothetical protein
MKKGTEDALIFGILILIVVAGFLAECFLVGAP